MANQTFVAKSESETDAVGAQIARALPGHATVGLVGTLGAGKTRLVKAIVAALGFEASHVVSPTFTLCNEYRKGEQTVYHLDLYRIADEDELFELGFDEYCNSPHLSLVEWSDRFPAAMPADIITVQMDVLGEQQRQISMWTS